jgi:hypothetical protein
MVQTDVAIRTITSDKLLINSSMTSYTADNDYGLGEALTEVSMDKVLTQYRESPNLLALIRHDLGQISDLYENSYRLPSKFDVLDAVGDQLTLIGKRLGWPRCHCICVPVPTFGFQCDVPDPNRPIVGLCQNGVWVGCQAYGDGDICLDDDETYRSYLLARRYQARQLWDIDSLQAAVEDIWGPTATVVNMGDARVAVQPGRPLTSLETIQLPVAFRVLPLAPGISPFISYASGKIFGFGTGWGGLCENANWLCPQELDPYNC